MSSIGVIKIKKIIDGEEYFHDDALAIEEPLQIGINYREGGRRVQKKLSVTMRTPGNDFDLAVGFLFTENIIARFDQVIDIQQMSDNSVYVSLSDDTIVDIKNSERNFYTTSSCGVCGKSSIDAIRMAISDADNIGDFKFSAEEIYDLPQQLIARQSVFEKTGGLHASAVFDSTMNLIYIREDVGRHNALDKLIGCAMKENRLPLIDNILLLSGRASFELIQKAAMAGIKVVVAVGAPSSLAVELAKERNMTLVGFLRERKFNIYCGSERIINSISESHNR